MRTLFKVILVILAIIVAILISAIIFGIYMINSMGNPKDIVSMSLDDGLATCNQKEGIFRDGCINMVAIAHFNESAVKSGDVCMQINDEEMKFKCVFVMATVNKNTELCMNFANTDAQNYCLAFAADDLSYCDKIVNTQLKTNCMSKPQKS
jgi:hypothetical protein